MKLGEAKYLNCGLPENIRDISSYSSKSRFFFFFHELLQVRPWNRTGLSFECGVDKRGVTAKNGGWVTTKKKHQK